MVDRIIRTVNMVIRVFESALDANRISQYHFLKKPLLTQRKTGIPLCQNWRGRNRRNHIES